MTQIKNELTIIVLLLKPFHHRRQRGMDQKFKNERSMKERKLDKTRSRSSSASKNAKDDHHRVQIVYQ